VKTKPAPRRTEEARPPRTIRLPGFLLEHEVGLGDAIKRATAAFGIKPCGPCEKRAAALNRLARFTR
jgi:hypothetical protein